MFQLRSEMQCKASGNLQFYVTSTSLDFLCLIPDRRLSSSWDRLDSAASLRLSHPLRNFQCLFLSFNAVSCWVYPSECLWRKRYWVGGFLLLFCGFRLPLWCVWTLMMSWLETHLMITYLRFASWQRVGAVLKRTTQAACNPTPQWCNTVIDPLTTRHLKWGIGVPFAVCNSYAVGCSWMESRVVIQWLEWGGKTSYLLPQNSESMIILMTYCAADAGNLPLCG